MSWVTKRTVFRYRCQVSVSSSCMSCLVCASRLRRARPSAAPGDRWRGRGRSPPAASCSREGVRIGGGEPSSLIRAISSRDPAPLGDRHPLDLRPELDVAPDRPPRIERVGLEDHAPVGAGPRALRPSISTSPRLGATRPAATVSRVDLPQPEGPTMHANWPSGTVSETVSSAFTGGRPPNSSPPPGAGARSSPHLLHVGEGPAGEQGEHAVRDQAQQADGQDGGDVRSARRNRSETRMK